MLLPQEQVYEKLTRWQIESVRKEGLQVIVQISRIDLTPESPSYRGEANFHTEGLRNENIVATTMYVVEAENITQARVLFQQEDNGRRKAPSCRAHLWLCSIDRGSPYELAQYAAFQRRAFHPSLGI